MAVTTKFGAVKNRTNGTFTGQNVGGAIMGVVGATGSVISASMSIFDAVASNWDFKNTTKQRAYGPGSGLVSSQKAISSGVYGYNAATAGTYIISRITTSIAGVASNVLLFMGAGSKIRPIHAFNHDFGVKMLTLWNSNRFAWTGRLASGATKASRLMWLNAAGTAIVTPAVLNTTYMRDIALGSATSTANDNAATVSRTSPGEFIVLVDFVTRPVLSGGSKFNYKPITGM